MRPFRGTLSCLQMLLLFAGAVADQVAFVPWPLQLPGSRRPVVSAVPERPKMGSRSFLLVT